MHAWRLLLRLALRAIALLKPCCFGDVMFTTPLLGVLRRAYPNARIDYLVSAYARPAIEANPLLDNRIQLPTSNALPGSVLAIARAVRAGGYDAVFVPDRSPLLALAVFLSGARYRLGLDSGGRGLLYTHRAPTSPRDRRHEADIYLDLARAIDVSVEHAAVEYTPPADDRKSVVGLLQDSRLFERPFALIHPGGGRNPGMTLDIKRWPPPNFARLIMRIMRELGLPVAMVGGIGDGPILDSVKGLVNLPFTCLGPRPWGQLGALAERSTLYLGNDTGATHMAVGAGTRVVMILGPTDPQRYAPYGRPDRVAYVWRAWQVPPAGVNAGAGGFSWDDGPGGATVDEVMQTVIKLLS
jgi:ADP-heptose:LPS heptosyltransferase